MGSESEPMRSFVDFQGIAQRIDATLGNAPECLETLLRVLSSSCEWLEARVVVLLGFGVAIHCHGRHTSVEVLLQEQLTSNLSFRRAWTEGDN